MKTRFRKIALATAVSSALLGVSAPSQALVVGNAGEALLIPLVVYSGYDGPTGIADVNTIIEIEIPRAIGWEDVANIYTARNTTPSVPGLNIAAVDPQLAKTPEGNPKAKLHWYFFNTKSVHLLDSVISITPDDVVQINWAQLASETAAFGDPYMYDGVVGYMVITDLASAVSPSSGAGFAMFGDAWLVSENVNFGPDEMIWSAPIPVMALTDGPDDGVSVNPTASNNVVFMGGYPVVSPLLSGIRTTLADGDSLSTLLDRDTAVFDLKLSERAFPTMHVVWNDVNLTDYPATTYANQPGKLLAYAFDTEEASVSFTVPMKCELNVYWVEGAEYWMVPPPTFRENDGWLGPFNEPVGFGQGDCLNIVSPPSPGKVGPFGAGYISYYFPEYQDRGTYNPETALTAFAIVYDEIGSYDDNEVAADTILAHDRGMFGHYTAP